jgi:hypothetical protein
METNDFLLLVMGERVDSEVGSSRQDEIRRCKVGETVHLWREPTNKHDPSAVTVVSDRGIKMGDLEADRCGWIGSKIDCGYSFDAVVDRLTGAGRGTMPVAMVIRVTMKAGGNGET